MCGRLIGKALNGMHNNELLGQITISNTRSKRVNKNVAHTTNKVSIHANFHICFSFGCHYNALFVLITISNTRSKRLNENITAHARKKNIYIQ